MHLSPAFTLRYNVNSSLGPPDPNPVHPLDPVHVYQQAEALGYPSIGKGLANSVSPLSGGSVSLGFFLVDRIPASMHGAVRVTWGDDSIGPEEDRSLDMYPFDIIQVLPDLQNRRGAMLLALSEHGLMFFRYFDPLAYRPIRERYIKHELMSNNLNIDARWEDVIIRTVEGLEHVEPGPSILQDKLLIDVLSIACGENSNLLCSNRVNREKPYVSRFPPFSPFSLGLPYGMKSGTYMLPQPYPIMRHDLLPQERVAIDSGFGPRTYVGPRARLLAWGLDPPPVIPLDAYGRPVYALERYQHRSYEFATLITADGEGIPVGGTRGHFEIDVGDAQLKVVFERDGPYVTGVRVEKKGSIRIRPMCVNETVTGFTRDY